MWIGRVSQWRVNNFPSNKKFIGSRARKCWEILPRGDKIFDSFDSSFRLPSTAREKNHLRRQASSGACFFVLHQILLIKKVLLSFCLYFGKSNFKIQNEENSKLFSSFDSVHATASAASFMSILVHLFCLQVWNFETTAPELSSNSFYYLEGRCLLFKRWSWRQQQFEQQQCNGRRIRCCYERKGRSGPSVWWQW